VKTENTRVVEGVLTHVGSADVVVIQHALDSAARRITASGRPVRFLDGTYVSSRARLVCRFAAESEDDVLASADLAQLPFMKIATTSSAP
jgi:hypothetical protein